MCFPLTEEQLAAWRSDFYDSAKNRLAQNVCTARDPLNACLRTPADLSTVLFGHKTWHEVEKPGKATTGGPGWICTGLDMLRLEFAKHYPVPAEFELSPGHLIFWHKLERCNYFLWTVAQLLERCEPRDGRIFRNLMKHAVPDGGNWQMFVNLVKKHGVMPKTCYLFYPQRVRQLNQILRSKLHEFASVLHAQYTFDGDASRLPKVIGRMLPQLYKVVSICLGEPPEEFTWKYYDLKKRYQCLENVTPLHFYEVMLAPTCDVNSFVCLGHDPRLSSSYQSNYEVVHSSNMVDGLPQRYNNQPMEMILQIIVDSLAGEMPVWLGCDLNIRFTSKTEVLKLSLKSHRFDLLFGLEVGDSFTKADRMIYKESRRNTALLLTAVGLNSLEEPVEFRTISASAMGKSSSTGSLQEDDDKENKEKNAKAKKLKRSSAKALSLEADWLKEYAFEIVVHQSFVPSGVLNASRIPRSMELPPWDPMGAFIG
ncbi:hypothetical protein KR009_011413 [Drosophila setifemur]|nr:hypothetical protein KR009_011413 [Drosophila setifemur]